MKDPSISEVQDKPEPFRFKTQDKFSIFDDETDDHLEETNYQVPKIVMEGTMEQEIKHFIKCKDKS